MLTDKEELKALGKTIKTARISRGFKTQKKFAEYLTSNPNASATIISRVETGKDLDFRKFLLISRKLELPISYFFKPRTNSIVCSFKDHLSLKEREEYELKRIGKIISNKRKSIDKTLLDFESGIGKAEIDSSNLSKIERGKSNFRLSMLIRICNELHLELEELFKK